jgi:hypothetical protein
MLIDRKETVLGRNLDDLTIKISIKRTHIRQFTW